MGRTVGIDLGTTYSLVATIDGVRPRVIPNSEGGLLTPSVVAFLGDGRRLVGQLAKRQAAANPDRTPRENLELSPGGSGGLGGTDLGGKTIASIKRKMGSDFVVRAYGREYTPEEISAMILGRVKADGERFLGEPIEKAVITVPAYFSDRQRQATKQAGRIAGLDVIRLVNEPTAAALAYGLERQEVHTVLVWDLGGGTFDVSILELGEGVFEVKAVNGDTRLGGDDFDQRLLDSLADEFRASSGVDLRADPAACQRLREAAEKAKIALSSTGATRVRLPFIASGPRGPIDLQSTVTREQLEDLTADVLQRMVGPTQQAMADAGVGPPDIDRVILVGGATRMPAVRALAERMLGKCPYGWIDPDKVVALGAAIQAGILSGRVRDVVLIDVTPLSLGIQTLGGIFTKIIERNTPIPTRKGQIFTNAADNQTVVDIHVLQGERQMARDNLTLDRFRLSDIPPQRRGEARVEVSFSIDTDGIAHVSALDLQTENSREIQVAGTLESLSEDQIGRMIEDARRFAAQDEEQREVVEIGIRADSMIGAAERSLEEVDGLEDLGPADDVSRAILEAKAAIAGGDSRAIRARTKELETAIKKLQRKLKNGKVADRSTPSSCQSGR